MQTFAPEGTDLELGFSMLDYQRLGKQRVEAWQILRYHLGLSKGWGQHPATKMWEGQVTALAHYGVLCCEAWISRGYRDTLHSRFLLVRECYAKNYGRSTMEPPAWLNEVAYSHKSNLIRKDPTHYGPLWPGVPDDVEYYWPVMKVEDL